MRVVPIICPKIHLCQSPLGACWGMPPHLLSQVRCGVPACGQAAQPFRVKLAPAERGCLWAGCTAVPCCWLLQSGAACRQAAQPFRVKLAPAERAACWGMPPHPLSRVRWSECVARGTCLWTGCTAVLREAGSCRAGLSFGHFSALLLAVIYIFCCY